MRLRYLLDTNICIYISKQKPQSILKKFESLDVEEVAMSMITYGELLYGAHKSNYSKQSQQKIRELNALIPVLQLSNDVADHYSDVRASLEKKGKPIGNNDLWIASHARALNIILVTNNVKEFKRVPHLIVENWI